MLARKVAMDQPEINIRYEGRKVIYDIVADREEAIDTAIQGLMNSYQPSGYGTEVVKKTYDAHGRPCAQVRRFDSCD